MEKKTLHLLILEDNPDDVELAVKELEREDFIVECSSVATEEAFREALEKKPDLLLVDYKLPSFDGMSAIKIQQELAPEVPLIIISGTIGEELAVGCMKAGATDYVLKDKLSRLGPVVKRALKEEEEHRKNKQAEEVLRKSEEKFRTLFEDSGDAIYLNTREGEFVDVNQAMLNLFGYTREEMIGMNAIKIYTNPEERSNSLREIDQKGFHKDYEIKFKKKDGRKMDCLLTSAARRADDGSILGYQGIIKDITERKQAEEKEKEHHKNIELLSETAMQFVEFPQDKDIYTFIGEQLQELIGKDSYVIVNSTDTESKNLITRAIIGMGKLVEKVASLIGKNPTGMTYNVEDEDLVYLSDGKLHLYEEGLYGISLKTIPKTVSKSIEKLLNIKSIFTIGFIKDNELFGTLAILLKENTSELKNKLLIETFIKQASIAIQKRRAEKALKESDENFQQVVSNITTVVWKADIGKNGSFENTYTSPVVDELLELPAGTLQNDWDKYFKYIKPEYLERVNNAFREAIISPGKTIDCEYEVLKDNGQTAWFHSNGRCFEKNGKIHVFGSTADITERKQAEEAIQKSEEKYRILTDNSIDAIWQMDLKLVFTYISPSVKNIMGYTVDEWVGSKLSQHASTKEFFNMAKKALYTIKHYKEFKHLIFDVVMLRKDGTEIPVEITAKLLLNKKGLPVGLQGATRDITERKQAEEDLKKKMNELEIFNDAAVDRELIINELRKEINELLRKLGKEAKHDVVV